MFVYINQFKDIVHITPSNNLGGNRQSEEVKLSQSIRTVETQNLERPSRVGMG